MSGTVALLVALVLVGAPLAHGVDWSLDVVTALIFATSLTAIAVAVIARVPENAFGWVLLAIGAVSALTVGTASADAGVVAVWLHSWIAYAPIGLLPIALLLFPTGRLPSERWRAALALAVIGVTLLSIFLATASAVEPDPLGVVGSGAGSEVQALVLVVRLGALAVALSLLLGVLSLVARMRRAPDAERRQILCLFLGALATSLGLALETAGATGALLVGVAALPVAAGVAILWHRLYDLDLFINRALVYGVLSAVLLAAYAAIVWLGEHLATRALPEGRLTLVAVAVVALGLDPLRRRLHRSVDRLLYGDRNDPYAVVTSVGRGLGSFSDAPATLTDAAEAVARSLALPYVAIEVRSDADVPELAEWGRRHGEPTGLALVCRGEEVGRLLVTPRTVHGKLSERDRDLLDEIAHSVALTVRAVTLSRGLQRAREELVTAREEERRRLRRDLHDGLGPTLASVVMQLDAASNVLRRDPSAVEPLLAGLRDAAQDAVGDIRRLVYALRPPALDELGLVGAIHECGARFSDGDGGPGLTVSLEAPSQLPPLPAAVEVAALRIVQEALANVARHAAARACVVRLEADGALVLDVRDNGRGLRAGDRPGVGLGSMRERAVELGGSCTITSPPGGGTHVHAVLPLAGA